MPERPLPAPASPASPADSQTPNRAGRGEPGSAGRPYGIVGDGRMGRHLRRYLELSGLAHRTWSRRAAAGTNPSEELASCPVILLLVSDAAVNELAGAFVPSPDRILVHCSGSLVTPRAVGMHPLSTFADDLYALDTYRAVPFICDRDRIAFSAVFPRLPNPHFTIAPALKPLYHGVAVLAGNLTTAVWHKFFATCRDRLDLPPEVALPFLHQVVANLGRNAGAALTGPVARRDRRTVEANLAALTGDPFHDVYAAFVRALAPDLLERAP